jgi:betaine-homocysteine S-methyltransferase
MTERPGNEKRGLMERLQAGPVICAEGYLFELERRGYVQAGAFVPEVVLDHPEAVLELHREFVRAGSDVVEAFTYYAHREKMRLIGREHQLEAINLQALALAKQVADETGALVAGDICNTNLYERSHESERTVRAMFEEQVGWAVDAGVDFIIGETYSDLGEALIALDVIKQADLPAVITIGMLRNPMTRDGYPPDEACKRLEQHGADVVGLNCHRGPATMLPLLKTIRSAVSGHVAALPVPYRTNEESPFFQSLRDHDCELIPGDMAFPTALDPFVCNRYEIAEFATEAYAAGVTYLGLCCGGAPHHIRSMAEALGRTPPASRYTADMSKHAYYGTDERLKRENIEYAAKL